MPTAIAAWFTSRGTAATPGYSVFILPWTASKANNNMGTRTQDSACLGGGHLGFAQAAVGGYVEWDIWLDAGTYKFAMLFVKTTDGGIAHVKLDGTDKGTIDTYAAAEAKNSYAEVTGIAVTAGLKAFRLSMDSKNASGTAHHFRLQSAAWIRTGA